MRVVSEADAIQNLPALLRDPDDHPIVINDGENDLRVMVSLKDYEVIRRANIERFLKASDALGEQFRSRAAKDGLSPEDLVKTFYPDATF